MKAVLDETSIRRLVREGIVRRMLNEGPEDYSFVPTIPGFGQMMGFGGGESAGAEKAKDLPKGFPSGRMRGERPADAIARVVEGKADRDPVTRASYVGPSLGESIKNFILSIEYVNTPFVVEEAENALNEWNKAVLDGEIPELVELDEKGKKTSNKLELGQGEEGLLRYLIAVKTAEMGFKVKINDLERQHGDYVTRLKPIVESIHAAIDGYTEANDINDIAIKVRSVVKADTTPQLLESKLLLAGFARENSTTGELLLPVGLTLGAIALLILAVKTGGIALAAFDPIIAGGMAAVYGWSAVAITSAVAGLWGLTEAGQAAINKYYESPVGDLIYATNNPEEGFEYLNELSREVSDTWFPLDSSAAYRRDALSSALTLIAQTDSKKSEILASLNEVIL